MMAGLGLAADIWGDTDFDSYGVHPRARWPMSEYIFNQIVPQLSLGSGLASSDPVTFKPKFITQRNWMIQAQYFWMHHNGTGFAECGTLINVTAGDVIETEIAFVPSSGAMTASIGVKGGGPAKQSSSEQRPPIPSPRADPDPRRPSGASHQQPPLPEHAPTALGHLGRFLQGSGGEVQPHPGPRCAESRGLQHRDARRPARRALRHLPLRVRNRLSPLSSEPNESGCLLVAG